MNPKGDIRGVVAITVTITIGETGVMGEMVAEEEVGEGDEVVITEAGTTDHRIGIETRKTEDRCLLVDMGDVDEVDQGAPHREGSETGVCGGTTELGAPPSPTHMDRHLQRGQLRHSYWNRARMSSEEISGPLRLTLNQLLPNLNPRYHQKFTPRKHPH